jgi:hypothetical protein
MSHDTSFLSKEKISIQEYKVDLTRHPKFPLAFGELASGRFPHCTPGLCIRKMNVTLGKHSLSVSPFLLYKLIMQKN